TVRADDRDGGVRLLTLDRPPANALDERLLTDLATALEVTAADDAVRAVVLTGAGPFFSGGFDLSAPRRDAAAARRLRGVFRGSPCAWARFRARPSPTPRQRSSTRPWRASRPRPRRRRLAPPRCGQRRRAERRARRNVRSSGTDAERGVLGLRARVRLAGPGTHVEPARCGAVARRLTIAVVVSAVAGEAAPHVVLVVAALH